MPLTSSSNLFIPTTSAEAIDFALEVLEPSEVAAFLRDYRDGERLDGWISGLAEDQQFLIWHEEDMRTEGSATIH